MGLIIISLIVVICLGCSENNDFINSTTRYYYVVGKINGPVKSIHLTSSNDFNDDEMDYTYLIDTVENKLSIYYKDRLDNQIYSDSKGKVDSNIWYKDDLKMKTLYHKSNFHESFPICTMTGDSIVHSFNYIVDTLQNTCSYYSDKGTLTRIDSFDIDGKLLVSTFDEITVRNEFNDFGDLISETNEFNNSNEKFKSQIIEYEYDHYGNWTKKVLERYYRGKKRPEYTMTIKREIEYY